MIDWTKPIETDEADPRPVRVLATDLDGTVHHIAVAIADRYPMCGTTLHHVSVFGDVLRANAEGEKIRIRNVRPKPVKRNVIVKVRQNRHGELIADVFEMGKEPQLPQYIAETMICVETIPAAPVKE